MEAEHFQPVTVRLPGGQEDVYHDFARPIGAYSYQVRSDGLLVVYRHLADEHGAMTPWVHAVYASGGWGSVLGGEYRRDLSSDAADAGSRQDQLTPQTSSPVPRRHPAR